MILNASFTDNSSMLNSGSKNIAITIGFITSITVLVFRNLAEFPSSCTLRREMTHSAMTEEERQALAITDTLVRISVGLEDPRDLIRDLEQALVQAVRAMTDGVILERRRYQYTTSVDINNTRYKRLQSLIQNHMRHVRSESVREQRIALYKSYE